MASMRGWLGLVALALAAQAEDLPKGRILDDVRCAANAAQSYALYVPSSYSEEHPASVIFAFDPILQRGDLLECPRFFATRREFSDE